MTLNDMITNKQNAISSKTIYDSWRTIYSEKIVTNKLTLFYSTDELGDATYHELRETYTASDIRKGFIWTSVVYEKGNGLERMIFDRILKDAEDEIQEEIEAAIANLACNFND